MTWAGSVCASISGPVVRVSVMEGVSASASALSCSGGSEARICGTSPGIWSKTKPASAVDLGVPEVAASSPPAQPVSASDTIREALSMGRRPGKERERKR